MTHYEINKALKILKSHSAETLSYSHHSLQDIHREKLKTSLQILGLEEMMPSAHYGKFIVALVKTLENQQKRPLIID